MSSKFLSPTSPASAAPAGFVGVRPAGAAVIPFRTPRPRSTEALAELDGPPRVVAAARPLRAFLSKAFALMMDGFAVYGEVAHPGFFVAPAAVVDVASRQTDRRPRREDDRE